MTTILGIDGGKLGGFAILDGESVIVEPMPLDDNGQLDLKELNRMFRHYADDITYAYLEMAGMRPGQATQSTFAFARNFGVLEGMLACLNIKTIIVQPAVWSKQFETGITEKNKAKRARMIKVARRDIVKKLYPDIDLKRSQQCKFADSGMVDALLIATFAWNKIKKGERHEERQESKEDDKDT